MNYRLSTFPYCKFIEYIDYKFYERGLSVVEVDAKKTSITCPVCGYSDRKNRLSREAFACRKCGFTFNAQYVACLNLLSRSNDGSLAIRGGRFYLTSRKAGSVVPADVAPNEPPRVMRWRERSLCWFSKYPQLPKDKARATTIMICLSPKT